MEEWVASQLNQEKKQDREKELQDGLEEGWDYDGLRVHVLMDLQNELAKRRLRTCKCVRELRDEACFAPLTIHLQAAQSAGVSDGYFATATESSR